MEIINNVQLLESKPLVYKTKLDNKTDRLDCTWFNPILNKKINELNKTLRGNKSIPLGEISKITGGKRLPKGTIVEDIETNYIPYIRGVDVKNLKIDLINCQKISKEIHQIIQNYQLKKNDIVISIVGTIGEIGILEVGVEVCDFTENIAKIRISDDNVRHKFLLHYLDSDLAKIQFEKYSVGSLQFKLSLNSLRNSIKLVIPIEKNHFSLKKQDEIMKKVNEHLELSKKYVIESENKISNANNIIMEEIKILFPNSKKTTEFLFNLNGSSDRLDALFNNPDRDELRTNIKKYKNYKPLKKLISFEKDNKVILSDFYKLVELKDIDENFGRISSYEEVPILGSQKVLFKKNTILLSKLQPETGKIVMIDNEFDGCVGSSELVPIRLKSDEVTLSYLWAVMRSDIVLKQWAYSLTGSSRMRIGKQEINETLIPIPDKDKQEKIVETINNLFEEAQELQNKSKKEIALAKNEFINMI